MDLVALTSAWSIPAFTAVFMAVAIAETRRPWRIAATPDGWRWPTNVGLYAGILALGYALPAGWVGVLFKGWTGGLFSAIEQHAGPLITLCVGLLLLDLLSYGLHRVGHLAPFWRFHAVHHADAHVDLTTGLRHHPGEFLVNAILGAVVLTLLGLPAYLVAVYGLLATLFDLWTHANLTIPQRVESALAWVVMTPGQHRVHHSADVADYDSNFGTVLTVWDRIFGSWRPPAGRELRLGLPGIENQGLVGAFIAPFLPQRRA